MLSSAPSHPPLERWTRALWLHSSSHATLGVGRLVGRLQHYSVLYVLSTPQITGACGRAIAAWVASGGILVSTGGGGLLDGAPASPLMPDMHRSPRSRLTTDLSRYFVPEPHSEASLSLSLSPT